MNEIVKVTDLCQTFYTKDGELKVLKDINFSLHEGQILTLLGPSGCGKSTILNILTKLLNPTSGERLRKSRLELGLSISEVANLCNVTKPVVSGYELNRYTPTKEVLNLLSSTFDMDYLCMDGYTKLIYNFDEFLYKLHLWICENNLTREDAANKLGVSRGLFRFWFDGGIIKISTYSKIKNNLQNYQLL